MALRALGTVAAMGLLVAACGGRSTATPLTPASGALATQAPTSAAIPKATPTPAPTVPAVSQPRYGGILHARALSNIAGFDTYTAQGGFSYHVLINVLSNLIRNTRDTLDVYEGDLAQSWSVSTDGKAYTFTLRKNVQWHDGKPLTSRDITYNLERALRPGTSFNRGRLAAIETIEALDDYTVKVNLKQISASFINGLSAPFVLMYPAHIPDMKQWQTAPVGTGGFLFASYEADIGYHMRRNPNYYERDAAARPLPYMDGIDWFTIADRALALGALRTGRLDCGCALDSDFLTENEDALRKEFPNATWGTTYGGHQMVMFNTRKPPFDNLAFRQAAAIGIDKETAGALYQGGKAVRPASPLFPPELKGPWGLTQEDMRKIPGFNTDRKTDLALAKMKLAESGIDARSVRLQIDSVVSSQFEAMVLAIAASLSETLGTDVKVQGYASADMVKRQVDGDFSIVFSVPGASTPDPIEFYTPLHISGGALNYAKWTNSRMDQLLVAQDAELDPIKRKAILKEAMLLQLTEFPTVPITWSVNSRMVHAVVKNFIVPPMNNHVGLRLQWIWLDRQS